MGCGGNKYLDKKLKIFKTNDKALWVFWVDRVKDNSSGEASSDSSIKIDGIAEYHGNESLEDTTMLEIEDLPDDRNVLFFTKTTKDMFELPTDVNGTINPNIFWAGYIDGSTYKALRDVKYPDIFYDKNTEEIELVFWSNVLYDDLPENPNTVVDITQYGQEVEEASSNSTPTTQEAVDLYPDSTLDGNENEPNAQRVVFYCTGRLKSVIIELSSGKKLVTNMFIFSKPVILFCPGTDEENEPNAVVDEFPGLTFLEFG